MAIPADKEELIAAIHVSYLKLKVELAGISPELTGIKELEGHVKDTKMSICNLVAYLTGWGQLVIKWHKTKLRGEEVDFPETGYKWNELGQLAQKFYKDYESDSYAQLLKKLDKTVNQIITIIETQSNKQLYEMAWYGKWTYGRMIQLNTSSPYKNAHSRIRKWKRKKGIE